MPQVNRNTMRKIHEALEESVFGLFNFHVTYPDKANPVCKIVFDINPKYTFEFQKNFKTTFSPGTTFTSSTYNNENIKGVIDDISSWMECIESDLKTSLPIYDEFEQLKEDLDFKINEHIEDPEGHFSDNDIDAIKEQMTTIRKKLKGMQKKSDLTETQLKEANARINSLEELAKSMNKGSWYKTTFSSIYNLLTSLSNSKTGMLLAKQISSKLLGYDETPDNQ